MEVLMTTMRMMIKRGRAAVEAASDQDPEILAGMSEETAHSERETFLNNAITNIHHCADHYGLDWESALDEFHYQAEKGTPLDEVPCL